MMVDTNVVNMVAEKTGAKIINYIAYFKKNDNNICTQEGYNMMYQ